MLDDEYQKYYPLSPQGAKKLVFILEEVMKHRNDDDFNPHFVSASAIKEELKQFVKKYNIVQRRLRKASWVSPKQRIRDSLSYKAVSEVGEVGKQDDVK